LGFLNQRSFNHTLSYIFSIFFYFTFFKIIIDQTKISVATIAKFVAISVLLNNGIIIIEWSLLNFGQIVIRDFFLTGGPGTSNMLYYTHPFFKAVAGTGEEPGGTASLINIYFPIGLWYVKKFKRNFLVVGYVIIHLVALTFLASVAGVVFLLITYFVWSLYKIKLLIRYAYVSTFILVVFLLLYNLNLFDTQKFTNNYSSYIIEKVTLSNSNISASTRKNMWKNAISDWQAKPLFGHGPGYGVEKYTTGYFNTFLTILADGGIISFFLFLSFLTIIIIKLFHIAQFDMFFMFISIGCMLLHSSIYYVYYHEPFWLPLILLQILYSQRMERQKIALNNA
jgi:O-antigen ligase